MSRLDKYATQPSQAAPTSRLDKYSGGGAPEESTPQEEFGPKTFGQRVLPQLQAKVAPAIYGAMNKLTGQDVQPDSYEQERDSNISRMQDYDAAHPVVEGAAPAVIPAGAIPQLGRVAEILSSTGPRRVAMGAAQGAMTSPEHPVRGALIGGGTALGGEALAKLLRGSGDVAMQAAVGRKKYTPGVGETLADEGVIGTRRGMQQQVSRKLSERGSELGKYASEIEGTPINARQIGAEIADEAARPMTSGGITPSTADATKLEAIRKFSEDVGARGAQSASQGLGHRIAAGSRSYAGKEDPLQSLIGKMSKAEQIKYSQALKAADTTGRIAPTDKAYAALAKARSGLDADVSLPKSLFGVVSQGVHGLPGGSLGASTIGQGLVKGGQATEWMNNPLLRQLLLNKVNEDK